MTRGELTGLLRHPHQIGDKEISELDHLIKKYPYCQTFHILKTKGMHNMQSLGYTEQLKLTAISVSDRKNLYELIMRESLLKQIEEVEKNIEIHEDKKEIPPIEIKPVAEEKSVENPVVNPVYVEKTIPEKPITIKLTEEIKEKIKFDSPVIPEVPVYLTEEANSTNEEKPDLTAAVEKSIPFKIEIPKTETKTEITEEKPLIPSVKISGLEQEILYEAINTSIQSEVWNDIVADNPEVKKPEEKKSEISADTTHIPMDFFGWLHVNDQKQEAKSKKQEVVEPEKESPQVIPTGQVKNLDDLIDKFIRTDPRITPSKAEFYSPTNVAKLSIVDKEEFVSETLAKIYEKQGYFDKAIKVYQKLSLKFPEKNSYFASLIEKVELQKAIEKQKKQK